MLHIVKIFVILIVIGVDTVETLTCGRNYSRSCLRKSAQGTVGPNKNDLGIRAFYRLRHSHGSAV